MELMQKSYVPLVRIRAVKERFLPYGQEALSGPGKVVNMVSGLLKDADREYMLAIPMDSGHKPVGVEVVAVGTLNQVAAEARDIFKHAILCNAASLVLVHNHPSGDPKPSKEDYVFTRHMKKAGTFLGIPLLDHIVVGDKSRYVSLRDEGRLE